MNVAPLYSDTELANIDEFLRDCVEQAAAGRSFARPVIAETQAKPEVERLRAKRKRVDKTITPEDLQELDEAMKSPYAPTFHGERDEVLEKLRQEAGDKAGKFPGVTLFLRHSAERLCAAPRKPIKPATLLISSSGLAWLLGLLHIPPVCAPAVVWVATKMRDIGVPAFCDTLKDYLKQHDANV
jgi:hypothetical protein